LNKIARNFCLSGPVKASVWHTANQPQILSRVSPEKQVPLLSICGLCYPIRTDQRPRLDNLKLE
ncbi:MAG: hypothetical protein WBH24_02490, partial [Candidatus Acidiferrum sp.]